MDISERRTMQPASNNYIDGESGCQFRIRHIDDVFENDRVHCMETKQMKYRSTDSKTLTIVDPILRGGIHFDILQCQRPKLVRMFVCSSGPDFEAERNYLFENVYPLVRQYCRDNNGLDFQLVDMYWGDSAMSMTDPHKMAAMYNELRHCQEVSIGPNFVAFVGQKYGAMLLPLEISSSDMKEIKVVLTEHGSDVTLLDKWFIKDVNVTPNVYHLQKHENDKYDELVTLIKVGLDKSEKSMPTLCAYSDFEYLLKIGLLDVKDDIRDRNCLVYMRNIKNIDQHLHAKNAGHYVDLDPETGKWDVEKRSKISVLRDSIEKSIPVSNIVNSEIELNGGALDEEKSEHYISNIGKHFYVTVTQMIDEEMNKRDEIFKDSLIHELVLHWRRAKELSDPFIGREGILNSIKGYLLSDTDQPFVLCGKCGSGKSTLVAKAACDINEAITNGQLSMPTALLVRFIGETEQSEDVQPLLYNLCHQLAYITGRNIQDVPNEYTALKNYFIDLIKMGEYGGMIVILLDSLDKLSTTDYGHKLDWLPSRMASNVKIVLTVNDNRKDMVARLENKIEHGLIKMPDFSQTDCENITKLLMGNAKRSVNYNQWKRIQMTFNCSSIPLFAILACEEAIKWNSTDDDSSVLQQSAAAIIEHIFRKLESTHSIQLVRTILGYLTASKNGLTESELEDILSLDDELLNYVYVSYNKYPSIRRIPQRCWPQLRQDLKPYLYQKEIDNVAVITWKYTLFAEVAKRRYLQEDTDHTLALYSNMADYFLGKWGGNNKKTFQYSTDLMAKYKLVERDAACCRYVPMQPLTFGTDKSLNIRKLSQLPYLLVHSRRYDDLKSYVFCNYDWLAAKIQISPLERVITEFEIYEDREIKLVADALRMSKSAILINPKSLGMELAGRLLPHIHVNNHIKGLIRQCDLDAQRSCPLVANCQIYSSPGGPLQYECDVGGGNDGPVNIDVFTSPDGILLTAKPCHSNRLRVWELTNGDERPDIMLPMGEVRPSRNGRFINIFVENSFIKTFRSDCGVIHGEVEVGPGKIAGVKVSNKYLALILQTVSGPYVIDLERSEILHKFKYHTHTVAISNDETFVAFNAERNIFLYELPTIQRRCVATATDVASDILFVNESPKCYIMTKTKLIESVTFDVVNKKYKRKTVLTDLDSKECILSNKKKMVIVLSGKTLHVIDAVNDEIRTRFQKLPPGVFVDSSATFSGAGFTPDDKFIVAARSTFLIVWNVETSEPVRVLKSAVSPMLRIFTSDSINKVVTLLQNNSIQIWNLDNIDSGTEHSIEIHQGPVKSVAVSSATKYILSHDSETPDAKLISLTSGKVMDTLQHSDNPSDKIVEVKLSPDGMYAITRAKVTQIEQTADTSFASLTDDIMWEVETVYKVFHASSARFTEFSPGSEMAVFVNCVSYNRFDWSENIYKIFIVNSKSSSHYVIDFTYNTEFVAPPKIVKKGRSNYFLSVIQTCRKYIDKNAKRETSRWTEIRLYIQQLTPQAIPENVVLLRLQSIAYDVGDNDQFLDIIPIQDGYILAVYAKDISSYEFVTDKGIVPPKSVRKGAVLMDIEKQTALKHFPHFLETSSSTDGLMISNQFAHVIDSELRVFKYDSGTFSHQIKSCKFTTKTAKLALNGRYIIGISVDKRNISVVRTADDKILGSVFVHGRANCLEIADDDRTVVVGCEDGRVMILSLILELSDPLREYIEKMPSRSGEAKQDENDMIINDVNHLSLSTPDLQRLSARMRKTSMAAERRPPSYSTLYRAVTVTQLSNRQRNSQLCIQQ